jgi:hypothetical protein
MEDVRTGEIYVCTGEINFRAADSIPVQITLSMRIVRDCFGNSVGDLHSRGAKTGKSIAEVRATIEIDDRFKLNSSLLALAIGLNTKLLLSASALSLPAEKFDAPTAGGVVPLAIMVELAR